METILNFESTQDLIDFIDYGSDSSVLSNARGGWSDGMSYIVDLLQNLPLQIEPEKFWKEFFPATAGLFFDIGLVCSGAPECWLDPQQSFNKGSFISKDPDDERKIIKIGINSTAPSGFSKNAMIERGAIVAVLAYLIEQSGRAVSITQYCSISKNNHTFRGSVILKTAEQTLDMNLLSFWLVCPDAFRQCWMRVIESLPNAAALGVIHGRYGTPEINFGENFSDVFIKGIRTKTQEWTRDDSVAWVCDSLSKLKINFFYEE